MPLRGGLRVVAIAALVAATGVLLSAPQIGFGLEEDSGLQWLFRLRGPRPAPPEAVVVRFDRDTFARLRALPDDPAAWPQPLAGCAAHQGGIAGLGDAVRLDRLPRGVIACLVEQLTRRGAAVIAFDISFRRDPDREAGVPALAEAHAHQRQCHSARPRRCGSSARCRGSRRSRPTGRTDRIRCWPRPRSPPHR